MLTADRALDVPAAGRADAPAPLELERVLLQAGDEHRVAHRHHEGYQEHDLRINRHQGSSFGSSYVFARADVLESTTPDGGDRIRACRAPSSTDRRGRASPGRCAG